MNIEIITAPLHLDIYGFSGVALDKDYAGTAFKLSLKMWETVKSADLKNKGLNVWVYEDGDRVFAGIELDAIPSAATNLEHKNIDLRKYAYFKHVGAYQLIKRAGQKLQQELSSRGFVTGLPYIEIYGHWTNDESKLETELIVRVE